MNAPNEFFNSYTPYRNQSHNGHVGPRRASIKVRRPQGRQMTPRVIPILGSIWLL